MKLIRDVFIAFEAFLLETLATPCASLPTLIFNSIQFLKGNLDFIWLDKSFLKVTSFVSLFIVFGSSLRRTLLEQHFHCRFFVYSL